jgi:hypothetical protein
LKRNVKGYLIAWDPVNQREVWRANYLGPCRDAGRRALGRDDGPSTGIGLAQSPCAARCEVFVGAMDDIVADRRGLRVVKHRPKRRHAAFLKRTVEHNAVPSVHGDVPPSFPCSRFVFAAAPHWSLSSLPCDIR